MVAPLNAGGDDRQPTSHVDSGRIGAIVPVKLVTGWRGVVQQGNDEPRSCGRLGLSASRDAACCRVV
jgi:hypothetical protein